MCADKGMTCDCLCLFKSLLKNLRGDRDNCLFNSVPGMALIQSEINRPQVFTAKCSEPQADTIKVGVKEVV